MCVFTDSKLGYGKVFHNFNMLINKTLFTYLLCLFDSIPASFLFVISWLLNGGLTYLGISCWIIHDGTASCITNHNVWRIDALLNFHTTLTLFSIIYEAVQCDNCHVYTWNIIFCNFNTVYVETLASHETQGQVTQQNIYHLLNSSELSSLCCSCLRRSSWLLFLAVTFQPIFVGHWFINIWTNVVHMNDLRCLTTLHWCFHRFHSIWYGPGI
jgi:hypothetical protein